MPLPSPDPTKISAFVDALWEEEIVASLANYVRIPNKSPAFDPAWAEHGHMDRAVALMNDWARAKIASLPGASLEVVRLPGRTPLIFIEVPGAGTETVLLYGHLDKQPEMTGWSEGLGPWTPVLRDDRLYGRGAADDGYAIYAMLAAILALGEQGVPHARCVMLIEACEESCSYDLPFYVEHLADRIGQPSLVVCLDSGCGNYDQLWLTTSLRGNVGGDLDVHILEEGVHSGDASGIVPSSFRILRQLMSRIEDERTGELLLPELHADIPAERVSEARRAAQAMGEGVWNRFPWIEGGQPLSQDPVELVLNRSWRPQLATIGVAGMPALADAGNVLRPHTAVKLAFRLPPTTRAQAAADALRTRLEDDPPYRARVAFVPTHVTDGWAAPALRPWLSEAIDRASEATFGKPAALIGEGGSIPFISMLAERFPAAQFVITGVLGPHANAHGPDEFLHLPTARKLSAAVALILADHLREARSSG